MNVVERWVVHVALDEELINGQIKAEISSELRYYVLLIPGSKMDYSPKLSSMQWEPGISLCILPVLEVRWELNVKMSLLVFARERASQLLNPPISDEIWSNEAFKSPNKRPYRTRAGVHPLIWTASYISRITDADRLRRWYHQDVALKFEPKRGTSGWQGPGRDRSQLDI